MLEKSCRVFDMGYKEVINLHDGARLGYVGDVDIDLESGRVTALIRAFWPRGRLCHPVGEH